MWFSSLWNTVAWRSIFTQARFTWNWESAAYDSRFLAPSVIRETWLVHISWLTQTCATCCFTCVCKAARLRSCLTLTLHSSHVHVARWSLFPTHRTAFISLRNIWNYDSIYKSLLLIKSPHSYFQSWWLTTFKYIFRFFSLNNPVLIRFNAIFIKCILFWGDLAYQTSN